MLAIGQALMSLPKLLILDEISLGLAPIIVEKVYQCLENICKEDIAILLAEQDVFMALNFTNRAYVLENGKIVLGGKSSTLLKDSRIKEAYLGL